MSTQPFRFLHAADLQLDRPCDGLAEIPEHLVDLLIDAPYDAARRVLETAISERVALVLLGGDLFGHAEPTARAFAFLRDQFRQYHEHGIEVCWASGAQPGACPWPEALALPVNVHHFSSAQIETVAIHGGRHAIAEVAGGGGTNQEEIALFSAAHAGAFGVAMTSGRIDRQRVSGVSVDYWAIAGGGGRATHSERNPVIHDPGPTQGRVPSDVGPHGCTLVEVDGDAGVQLRFMPCDQLRWQTERLTVSAEQPVESWRTALAERSEELRQLVPDIPLLVTWKLEIVGNYTSRTPITDVLGSLTGWLRDRFGSGSALCWTASLDVDSPAPDLDQWRREDTLLGDYLRAVETTRESGESLVRHGWPTDTAVRRVLESRIEVTRPDVRQHVLSAAAELGAALLRGEQVGEFA